MALAWDFTFPGTYELPMDRRTVAMLAPGVNNRITIQAWGDPAAFVRLQAYDDPVVQGLDTSIPLGSSVTFDLPWSDANVVTLVLGPSVGTGTYGVGWSAVRAPVPQNSFLLPLPTPTMLILLILAAAVIVIRIRDRSRARWPPPPR